MGLAGQSVGELQANKRPASKEVNTLHTHHTCTHMHTYRCIHRNKPTTAKSMHGRA